MKEFDWKKFLMTGVVGALSYGFIAGIIPSLFTIWGDFTVGKVLGFGVAFFIAEYVYQNWG